MTLRESASRLKLPQQRKSACHTANCEHSLTVSKTIVADPFRKNFRQSPVAAGAKLIHTFENILQHSC